MQCVAKDELSILCGMVMLTISIVQAKEEGTIIVET